MGWGVAKVKSVSTIDSVYIRPAYSLYFTPSIQHFEPTILIMLGVALLALIGSTSVEAHKGCGGGEIMRRNPGGALVTRDDGTWQSEAALSE